MNTEIVTAIPAELERAVADTGLSPDGAASIAAGFAPHFIAFREIADRSAAVKPDAPKQARALRLELKGVRVAAEHTRKTLKEDSLRRGKAIDGIKALLDYSLVPVEEAMQAIEEAEERREAERRAALKALRMEQLSPFCDPQHFALDTMPEADFAGLLAGQKAAKEAREAAEAKRLADEAAAEKARQEAEAKRIADEAAERERLRAENARLAAEKAEAEKAAAAEREAAAKAAAAAAAEAKRVQDIADAKAAEERKVAAAREEAAREEARKAKAEAARLAAIESERVRVETERKAAEAKAARDAAAAPDKAKMAAFAAAIRALHVPEMATDAGKALAPKMAEALEDLASRVDAASARL